jgi:hypothetical protein
VRIAQALVLSAAITGCAAANNSQHVCAAGHPSYVCSTPPLPSQETITAEVYTVGVFPDYLHQEILYAIREWNMALNGHLRLKLVGSVASFELAPQDSIVIIATNSRDGMVSSVDADAMAVAYPWGHKLPSALIYVAVDKMSDAQFLNMVHELGHALGAEDNPKGPTLMSRAYYGCHCVDLDAAKQVSRAFHWDLSTLNYCK